MKISELRNQHIEAGKVPDHLSGGEELYFLRFTDKGSRDAQFLWFPREARDAIISSLQGSGIVVAQEVPKH